jgi:hypothetical protein
MWERKSAYSNFLESFVEITPEREIGGRILIREARRK